MACAFVSRVFFSSACTVDNPNKGYLSLPRARSKGRLKRMTPKSTKAGSTGRRDARKSYAAIIERIFLDRYKKGRNVVEFTRRDLIDTAHRLKVDLPKNIGD